MSRRGLSVACGLAIAAVTAVPARAAEPAELLQSVLWVQKSLEYQTNARSVYQGAAAQLRAAVSAPGSATPEDVARGPRRPAAIVLDLDETALDNSAYSGWMVRQERAYDEPSWQRWIALEQARAVPGAVEFTRLAARRGIAVFYVSNRECVPLEADPCPAKRHTMANLARLGFPRAGDPAALLLKRERPDWGSDKSSRRQLIAQTHRIVMMFGDDLGDFLAPDEVHRLRGAEAQPQWQAKLALFGKRWFMLPNPMYGSWEQGLPEPAAQRREQLDTPDGLLP